MSTQNTEILEALRLLHERVSRIETGGLLPTSWNPFAGASKSELERIAMIEQVNAEQDRTLVHNGVEMSKLEKRIQQLEGAPSAPPAYYPLPQFPTQPPYYPAPSAPPAPQS